MKTTTTFPPALLVLFVSINSHAISEFPDWYSDSTPGDSIEQVGLEWLTWDNTIGMSIADALSAYSSEGWRLASNAEMASLFNAYFYNDFYDVYSYGDGTHYDGSSGEPFFKDMENVRQSVLNVSVHPATFDFLNAFGLTSYGCEETQNADPLCQGWSSALFGSDNDSDGFYNRASINYHHYNALYAPDSWASLSGDMYDTNQSFADSSDTRSFSSGTGVALVRKSGGSTQPPVMSAPEISTSSTGLALALLGSLVMFFRERKKLR